MVENVYYLRILLALMAPTALRAGVLDDIFGVASDTVCAVMSAKDIELCGRDFNNEINSVDNQVFEELKTRKLCCAFNHLRDCIIDSIGDKCGEQRDSVVQKLVSTVVGTAKDMTYDCRTYYGNTGNVLCLNDYVLILILIGLVMLFLFICSATVRMCCGSTRRYNHRGESGFHLLPQHNTADKPRY